MICSRAAFTARSLAYSFFAWPLWPRTQVHCTSCSRELASSAFQSSRFSIGPSLRLQPRADPARDPFAHALHEVLRVGHDQHPEPGALLRQELQRRDGAGQRHPVVGGGRGADVEVPPLDPAVAAPRLDQPAAAARVLALAAVAEAALVEVQDRDAAHPTTWKLSIWSSRKVRSSPVIGRRPIRTSWLVHRGHPERHDDVLRAAARQRHPLAAAGGALELIHAIGGPADGGHEDERRVGAMGALESP